MLAGVGRGPHAGRADLLTLYCAHVVTASTKEQRYARGIEILRRIGGPDFDLQLQAAAQTAPDLARLTVEFAYGDIIARQGLALPLRQVVTVAALLGHRNAEPQLRYHMVGYLNVGGAPQVLIELLFVSIVVLGFPVAIRAIALVRDIFKERGIELPHLSADQDDGIHRQHDGRGVMDALLRDADTTFAQWEIHHPSFARWSLEFEYGERSSSGCVGTSVGRPSRKSACH